MKIDKLGFYKSQDGYEIEIIFISKQGEFEFMAVGKRPYTNRDDVYFITYINENGTHHEDNKCNLIEYLRPSGVEWPTPRKTSFVAYLNEGYVDKFDLTDVECISCGMSTEKPEDIPGYKPRKISKWRFYGEEILGK